MLCRKILNTSQKCYKDTGHLLSKKEISMLKIWLRQGTLDGSAATYLHQIFHYSSLMQYPVNLRFTKQLTCIASFPDHPHIQIAGPNKQSTLAAARILLIKELLHQLEYPAPIPLPSPCKIGQHLVLIPEDLAIQIILRHTLQPSSTGH